MRLSKLEKKKKINKHKIKNIILANHYHTQKVLTFWPFRLEKLLRSIQKRKGSKEKKYMQLKMTF